MANSTGNGSNPSKTQKRTRDEISQLVRAAESLEECREAEAALDVYLEEYPEDWDLRDEASGLYLLRTALERIDAQNSMQPSSGIANVSR